MYEPDGRVAGQGAHPPKSPNVPGPHTGKAAVVVVVGGLVVVVGRGLVVGGVVMSRVWPAHPVGIIRLEAGQGAHPVNVPMLRWEILQGDCPAGQEVLRGAAVVVVVVVVVVTQ